MGGSVPPSGQRMATRLVERLTRAESIPSSAFSAFSIPMLLDRKLDAFSAMAMSMSLVWNNLPAALLWGAIILLLTLLSLGTALIGLIIIFPLLGHATWHAYAAVRD